MDQPHRKTIRLQNYDYTQGGAYFITICTWQRQPLFGNITNGEMTLTPLGHIVHEEWWRTEEIRKSGLSLDEFVIMPNHLHGIIFLENETDPSFRHVGADRRPPANTAQEKPPPPTEPTQKRAHSSAPLQRKSGTIGSIMAGFKSAATTRINQHRNLPRHPVWQRGYWDRIIRDEKELHNTRQYILNNPINWMDDEYNPSNLPPTSET